MRISSWFLLLAVFISLLAACAGQAPSPTPVGQAVGKPTLHYVFADP